jgi:hypothetical protein
MDNNEDYDVETILYTGSVSFNIYKLKYHLSFIMFNYCRICPKGKTWYLLKWLGYEEATWTFYKDVGEGCCYLMRKFMEE